MSAPLVKIIRYYLCVALTGLWASSPLHADSSIREIDRNAVALLALKDQRGQVFSTGSGFVADASGTLITNYHVLVGAHSVEAVFPDGTAVPVKHVAKVDRKRDFAVLQLDEGRYSTLELGNSDDAAVFDYATAFGYLSEDVRDRQGRIEGDLIQTHGFVLGKHLQAYTDFPYFYVTTPLGPGFSGGPVLDRNLRVIGLATLDGKAMSLALPINEIKPFIGQKRLATFAQFRDEDKNANEAEYYRGNFALYGDGDLETAMRHFQSVVKRDPEFVLAYYDMAVIWRERGEPEKAIDLYKKVLRINPRFPEALLNLGGQIFRSGRTEEALAYFKEALLHYPNFAQALSNLGAALNKLRKPEEAIPYLAKTLELDPEFGVAYFNLGNSLYSLHRLDEAEKNYAQSLALGVDFVSMRWNLYDIYRQQGKLKDAKNQLQAILSAEPDNAEARRKLDALK